MAVAAGSSRNGIDCNRLMPVGFGETKPVAPNNSPKKRPEPPRRLHERGRSTASQSAGCRLTAAARRRRSLQVSADSGGKPSPPSPLSCPGERVPLGSPDQLAFILRGDERAERPIRNEGRIVSPRQFRSRWARRCADARRVRAVTVAAARSASGRRSIATVRPPSPIRSAQRPRTAHPAGGPTRARRCRVARNCRRCHGPRGRGDGQEGRWSRAQSDAPGLAGKGDGREILRSKKGPEQDAGFDAASRTSLEGLVRRVRSASGPAGIGHALGLASPGALTSARGAATAVQGLTRPLCAGFSSRSGRSPRSSS